MSAGCTIRLATPEDGPGISASVVSLARYLLEDPDDHASAAPFFETVSADAIGGAISGGRFIYHLAEAGGGLVGAVGVRDGCHLYHLFVAEAWQGRGVGGALWRVARGVCGGPRRGREVHGERGGGGGAGVRAVGVCGGGGGDAGAWGGVCADGAGVRGSSTPLMRRRRGAAAHAAKRSLLLGA